MTIVPQIANPCWTLYLGIVKSWNLNDKKWSACVSDDCEVSYGYIREMDDVRVMKVMASIRLKQWEKGKDFMMVVSEWVRMIIKYE